MSRMRVPEMDVIRFNESDVIVASGAAGKTATVVGIGGGSGDLGILLGENKYTSAVNGGTDFSSAVGSYLGLDPNPLANNNSVKFYYGTEHLNAPKILSSTTRDMDTFNYYSYYNGDYYWDSSAGNNGAFVHQ